MTVKTEIDTSHDAVETVKLFYEDDAEALMELIVDRLLLQSPDTTSLIASSKKKTFMTLAGLRDQIEQRLVNEFEGRCHVEQAATYFGVTDDNVRQSMATESSHHRRPIHALSATNFSTQEEVVVEYVTDDYLDRAAAWMHEELRVRKSCVLLSEMLSALPLSDCNSTLASSTADNQELWLKLLEDRLIDNEIEIRLLESGSRVFNSAAFWASFCTEIYNTLTPASQEVSISDFCQEHDWDPKLVIEALFNPPDTVRHLRPAGELQGGKLFVPEAYLQKQQQLVTESFQFHGYILVRELCAKTGWSSTQLIRHLVEIGGDDVVVAGSKGALLSRKRLLDNWMALVQEANEAESWCEFPVPVPLFDGFGGTAIGTRQELLDDCLLGQSPLNSKGLGIISLTKDGNALYVSASVVDNLTKVHLAPFVTAAATERATVLVESKPGRVGTTDPFNIAEWMENDSSYMPSLQSFVEMVSRHYPDLGEESSQARSADGNEEGVIHEFCRRAFTEDNQHVEKLCQCALAEQLQRCLRQKQSGEVVLIGADVSEAFDETGEHRDEILVPFDDSDCFVAACFQLQSYIKFYHYAVKHDMESVDLLECEIRSRTCVDFTRRLHQYCMSLHEDLPPFVFSFRDKDDSTHRLPLYCSKIDIASRDYGPRLILSCSPDPDSGKQRDPETVLLELLPRNAGQALREMYNLCLDGLDNDSQMKAFLEQAEEHTITICGLPFKKLDKRNEKSFLASRKHELKSRLEKSKSPTHVLELTIMLLYQSIKSQCVAGSLLTGPVLSLLLKERKITEPVGEVLQQLASKLEENEPPGALLVESVRRCGLCKDIAKHAVS